MSDAHINQCCALSSSSSPQVDLRRKQHKMEKEYRCLNQSELSRPTAEKYALLIGVKSDFSVFSIKLLNYRFQNILKDYKL